MHGWLSFVATQHEGPALVSHDDGCAIQNDDDGAAHLFVVIASVLQRLLLELESLSLVVSRWLGSSVCSSRQADVVSPHIFASRQ